MSRPPSGQPTDGELEILKVLWDKGPSGLGPIHATLLEQRPVAVTTVATMLKMMRDKDLVARGGAPRNYVWSALVSRKAAASGMVGKLIRHVFDGSAHRLVAHLIQSGELTDAQRDEIAALLSRHKGETQTGEGQPS